MSDVDGTVVAIQGREVDDAAPNDGDIYRWDATASKWVPVVPPQPLEPWVGSVNTQQKVIKRIPWTCRSTGTAAVSTGVSFTLPTDTGLALVVNMTTRWIGYTGVRFSQILVCIANGGGTLTSPNVNSFHDVGLGTPPNVPYSPEVSLSISGTTVTVQIAHSIAGPGDVLDMQGFVDLMSI